MEACQLNLGRYLRVDQVALSKVWISCYPVRLSLLKTGFLWLKASL